MPAIVPSLLLQLLFLLLSFSSKPAISDSGVVLESGYTVSTVLDCNKPLAIAGLPSSAAVYPFALLPRPQCRDLLLLDSSGSAFYSLAIPLSQEGEVRLFSGKGVPGFADGDPMSAMFKNPRSFAIDSKDNVYVADRSNHAIRKISRSGISTTIAGGYSEKTGHIDGPAQNASFSNDFELVYVPKICALMISDRGNRLIRQMDLKPEDCAYESQTGLGVTSVSVIAIFCALFGIVLGFIARPFFTCNEVSSSHSTSKTWKHYQTNLRRLALMACSDVKNAVADSMLHVLLIKLVNLSLCYLSTVFRNITLGIQVWFRESIPLLESDVRCYSGMTKSSVPADRLKDMISFDGDMDTLEVTSCSRKEDETKDASKWSHGKIEDMIRANLTDFVCRANQSQMEELTLCSSCLVRRRPRELDGL
ncbi:NHL repeat-containing protein 2 [Cocos nucifera]|uniref:NHL repeat-containing protein 2 n=1 Tax=Cocos nucifera TaxID=13894 RepID=A0A8K0MUG6_COCNU|nr:NHL repeat-containing protein 2 [Cocos nucifera]